MDSYPVTTNAQGVVVISYSLLVHEPEKLLPSIAKAFGSEPDCLGLILVKDLPKQYDELRSKLLHLVDRFACLDENVRNGCSDPLSRYSFGWSHGKEIMNGKPDTLKGSYYANVIHSDLPGVSDEEKLRFPEYYGSNIWPKDIAGMENFESAFQHLGKFILNVGEQLATACQPFVADRLIDSSIDLRELIARSHTTKGRALHYFSPPVTSVAEDDMSSVNACGYHLDHSLLTGLCSAMYLAHTPGKPAEVVESPSPVSGLYIRTRGDDVVKAAFPVDCLAFQTGEALEIATGGRLSATPHYVRVEIGDGSVTRETFALFMQPDTDCLIGPKETFGQFSQRIFDEHYQDPRLLK